MKVTSTPKMRVFKSTLYFDTVSALYGTERTKVACQLICENSISQHHLIEKYKLVPVVFGRF